ncbi:MAG: DUF4296 domain-containing protein, partial [Muribaculaceae bacterium]|nr:DUF4296 domain-containing protein [Muribaculaceae bacterium]
MWYKSKLILSALVMLLITTGCDKRPENVLDDSEMVDLMTDLLLADALEQSSSMSQFPDSIRHDLGERILREHGINRVTLDSTFSWYSRNIDDYYRLYAKVDKQLKKMRKSVGGNLPETENENNIWELPGYFKFTDFAAGDAMTFALPGEKVEKGEELKWRLFSEENVSLDLLIGIDYEDGTSSFTRRETHGGHTELTVVADTALKASRIYGFIWAERTGRSIWIDSI